jgi:hypothetical protein
MDEPDDEKQREDIADVIREEIPRRRPIDMDDIRARSRRRAGFLTLLRGIDERTFREMLSEHGVKHDSPQFDELLAAWRALQRPSS